MRSKLAKRVALRRTLRQLRKKNDEPIFQLGFQPAIFNALETELWDEYESIGVMGSSLVENLQAWIDWMIENKEAILELILFLKEFV